MKSHSLKKNYVIAHYLKNISLPKLTKELREQCHGEITKNEVKNAPKNMDCNKTPGNDSLTSEFYKVLWPELKTPYFYKKSYRIIPIRKFFCLEN